MLGVHTLAKIRKPLPAQINSHFTALSLTKIAELPADFEPAERNRHSGRPSSRHSRSAALSGRI